MKMETIMDTIRIWRSPYSPFGELQRREDDRKAETFIAEQVYTDEELGKIAGAGFNAIWVHTLLHQVVNSPILPELGVNCDLHLNALRKLIDRAAKHGLKVFLYMQPPRALPVDHPFWEKHPEAGGNVEKMSIGISVEFRCFCTSQPVVKEYLRSASEILARELPALGGIIMITASECASHCIARCGNTLGAMGEKVEVKTTCPHCAEREPSEIISEIITLMRNGIRAVSDTMEILAWNWSWTFYYDKPCREVIERLPKDVILMAGFERGGKQDYCGRKDVVVDEYSISYAGPSEQCREAFAVAEECGLRTATKLQFGTTHELATVVSLPLLGNVFRKADFMRRNNMAGFMGCWNFGNMLSANTAGFNYFLSKEAPADESSALQTFAADYMPGCKPEEAMKAWYTFAEAMLNYPFGISYLYAGPTNYSLAYIPRPEKLNDISGGGSWLMHERGDDLSGCLGDFSVDEVIAGFEKLSAKWAEGVSQLENALSGSDSEKAVSELANAKVCGAVFHSSLNTFKFYKLRLDWSDEKIEEYKTIAKDELAVLETIKPVVASDKRLGYHSEAHDYMFNEEMIQEKIKTLKSQINN
jgi:hypothetical protein